MAPIVSFIVFPLALSGVLISAHYFLRSATSLGLLFGASPFVIGSFIVALGTSFPEFAIALFSIFNGAFDIPVAQVAGSNIANILLIIGIVTLISRRLNIIKKLIDVELPLITSITALFVFIVWDGAVSSVEGFFLFVGFLFYGFYIFRSKENRENPLDAEENLKTAYNTPKSVFLFIFTSISIGVFSVYTVKALEGIAVSLSVPEGIIAVTVLAFGTSLPELVVSIRAAFNKEIELLVGNIVGSNIFNILFVVSIPALIKPLTVDTQTLQIGIPMLIVATVLFVVSGISNRVHIWEGIFFLLLYLLFIAKVIGIL